MQKIPRVYKDNLNDLIKKGKVLVIYGPRRVGKTTLLQDYLDTSDLKYKFDSGERLSVQQVLGSGDFDAIFEYIEGYELLVIDEAQVIPGIGAGLKIIVDHRPDVRIVATGSSSFDLARSIGEPLVGRKKTLRLFPIAQSELLGSLYNKAELKEQLEDFLIFGSYPDVLNATTRQEKIDYLLELVDSYLLKDILALDNIKSPKALLDLLKLLAFQVGSEVSLNELAGQLGWDAKTVGRYLDLLEQCFIITRVGGFGRNLRNEVTAKNKYFFVDNGIRNAIISQFNSLDNRDDIGKLWENFIFSERFKNRSYKNIYGSIYFWRTYQGQEIDFIEERDGQLHAYEVKWSSKKRPGAPKDWSSAYPDATYSIVNNENYLDYITGEK